MPQLVWIANSEMQVTYYNARAAEYGVTLDQNDRYQWAPAVHPDDLEATAEAWRAAVGAATMRRSTDCSSPAVAIAGT